jgi:hypothetical protein
MSLLATTPPHLLVDAQGRPYFLWDVDMTLDRFRSLLRDGDEETRTYLVGKLMREAKPEDVFLFVTRGEIDELWPRLQRHLGRMRDFWNWTRDYWRALGI